VRDQQIFRLLGSFPSMAAESFLRRSGTPPQPLPELDPTNPLSYTEAYLASMGLGKAHPLDKRPHPRVVRALDALLIIHADHELNCSTAAVRHLTTSGVDVFTAVSGATGNYSPACLPGCRGEPYCPGDFSC
jgi:citrate synthase